MFKKNKQQDCESLQLTQGNSESSPAFERVLEARSQTLFYKLVRTSHSSLRYWPKWLCSGQDGFVHHKLLHL